MYYVLCTVRSICSKSKIDKDNLISLPTGNDGSWFLSSRVARSVRARDVRARRCRAREFTSVKHLVARRAQSDQSQETLLKKLPTYGHGQIDLRSAGLWQRFRRLSDDQPSIRTETALCQCQ